MRDYKVTVGTGFDKRSIIGYFAGVFILLFFGAAIGFYTAVQTINGLTDAMVDNSVRLEQ